jgi:hypothetical protein
VPGPSANGGHLGGGHCSPLPLPLSQARPRLAGRPLLWAGQSRAVPPGCSSAPPSSVCQQHQRGTRLRRLQQHPPTLVLAPVMHVLDSLGCQAQGPSGPRAFPIPLASSPAPSSTRSSSPDAASAEPESRGMTARSPRGASRLASAAGGSLERGSGSGGDPRRGAAWLSSGRAGDVRRNVRACSDLHASSDAGPGSQGGHHAVSGTALAAPARAGLQCRKRGAARRGRHAPCQRRPSSCLRLPLCVCRTICRCVPVAPDARHRRKPGCAA